MRENLLLLALRRGALVWLLTLPFSGCYRLRPERINLVSLASVEFLGLPNSAQNGVGVWLLNVLPMIVQTYTWKYDAMIFRRHSKQC